MVLAKLGAEVDLRFGFPDGFNINLDCGSTHPPTLSRLVQESGAAFGVAHDGDADRVLFCDEKGIPLDGDDLLAIASADLLARNQLRANTLVATVMSNFGLDEVLRRRGGKVLRTRPLCAYPQVATYQGQGSPDDAANFRCADR